MRLKDLSQGKCQVIIADDHPLIVFAITKILENVKELQLAGSASSSSSLLQLLQEISCDVLLCDYSFDEEGDSDGLQLIKQVQELYPHIKIIVLTAHDDIVIALRILSLKVAGFISKSSGEFSDLPFVIGQVQIGRSYIDPVTLNALTLHQLNNGKGCENFVEVVLSEREQEVLRLFALGMTVSEIALHTQRSVKTISTQKKNAMDKLGVSNVVELLKAIKGLY
ncbi:LuxR family two component transcriptional regulator [Iodobacter fluviatilis]|uniref:Capsular synthesis regulator component B n=1 Tax=Iodobacter fluviatilis TaxID=537 RepID=A0A377Q4P0_9NEIS|nr:LuxR family two component transcriptional regulator [Iodobacter fluviatilis]STQ90236.1 Capsular synthesis regulator component B [Iodobacter fluviatilis]